MKKKIILGSLVLILLVTGFIGYKLFSPAVSNKQGNYFYIKNGETLAGVKEELKFNQFISADGFDLACKLLKYKKVKPGQTLSLSLTKKERKSSLQENSGRGKNLIQHLILYK